MTVPSGEVTVLMSWPRFVEAGRVNLMTAGTATTHRSRTVAIHRSGDAVPRAQAHHRSSPPWRDLAASASLLVRIRMLVPSDAACSSGASANRVAAATRGPGVGDGGQVGQQVRGFGGWEVGGIGVGELGQRGWDRR